MTTIIFVRHGQSQSNLDRVFTGQCDTPLTPLGVEQARRTAEFLRSYPITRIYASDLSRAMETAKPTAELHGLPIFPNRALREVFAGDWEGLRYDDVKQRYPESHRAWWEDVGNAHPNGGESVKELYKRVTEEVARLVELHRGETVALFSHATPARAMGCYWYGVPVERMREVPWVSNASVSVVEYNDDGTHRVLLYSYDKHQGDTATVLPKGSV
ncbi:MAG: histidine phosphatase family protein [Ruminococcaceae bacterium]|nr:histidine phosphatase family protein [Oscillospiraceae bacterium]